MEETAITPDTAQKIVATKRDEEGRLQPDGAEFDSLAQAIEDDQQLIIFRGAYSRDEMREFRRQILDWASATDAWPQGESASQPGINFHRIDDGTITGRMAHIFHLFGFGKLENLPEPLRSTVSKVCRETFDLQNRLAGTDFVLGDPAFRIKAIRHPRGGGYLVPHAHPYEPQRVAIFLNLSEPGEDYQSGSARFRHPTHGWIDTSETFRCGDLIAWHYSMVHELAPIDPDADIDWSGDNGLWIFAMEWVEAHDLSEAVSD